jgi:hypothetical protein
MAVTITIVHHTGATITGTIVTINKQTALLNQQGCFVYMPAKAARIFYAVITFTFLNCSLKL